VILIDLTAKICFRKQFLLGTSDWNTKSLKCLEAVRRSEAIMGSGFGRDILVGKLIVAIGESSRERAEGGGEF
jgi:hypothetical protein